MDEVDAVVYGAGYAGLTAAYRLVREGLRVIVVEIEPGISHKSYYGGTGFYDEVFVHRDYLDILREYSVADNVRTDGEGVWINGMYLLSSILKKIFDHGGRVLFDSTIEPIYEYSDEKGLSLKGIALLGVDEGFTGTRRLVKTSNIIDATSNASLISLISDRLKLDIPVNGYGVVVPGNREVVDKTSWILEGVAVAGLAVSYLAGTPLPFPDVGPLMASGWKAGELVLKGFNPGNRGNILYPWII